MEINYFKKKSSVFIWVIALWLIIASGLRGFVGADYGVYRNLFSGFSMFTTYQDVFDKAIFRQTSEQIEWLYVLLNKIAVSYTHLDVYKRQILVGAFRNFGTLFL